MLEQVLLWERDLFLYINHTHTDFLDRMMWLFTGKSVWIPLILIVVFALVYKINYKQWLGVLLAIGLVVLLCDQFSSHLCKPLFTRFRPTHHPLFMDEVRTLFGYTGGNYGFISGHATNAFGFATLTALLFRKKFFTITIFIWAFLMGYSRVYIGVHFISDVVAGAVAGTIIGLLVYFVLCKVYKKWIKGEGVANYTVYSNNRGEVIATTIIIYVFSFSLFSQYLIPYLR